MGEFYSEATLGSAPGVDRGSLRSLARCLGVAGLAFVIPLVGAYATYEEPLSVQSRPRLESRAEARAFLAPHRAFLVPSAVARPPQEHTELITDACYDPTLW